MQRRQRSNIQRHTRGKGTKVLATNVARTSIFKPEAKVRSSCRQTYRVAAQTVRNIHRQTRGRGRKLLPTTERAAVQTAQQQHPSSNQSNGTKLLPTHVASCMVQTAQPYHKRSSRSAGSAAISTQTKTRGQDTRLLPTNVASCSADSAETSIFQPEAKVRSSCQQT